MIKQLFYDQELRNGVMRTISSIGGSKDDFDEVFDESLMRFVKSVVKNRDLEIKNTIQHYIAGIARYVTIALLKGRNQRFSTEITEIDIASDATSSSLIFKKERHHLLQEVLGGLGRNCKEVLMHWANGYSMKEIADLMNYQSDTMARKKKYQCFKALSAIVAANPNLKEALRSE